MPTCAVSTECLGWLLEICGYSGAQGTPRDSHPQPIFHPGSRLHPHRIAFQQRSHGPRGETSGPWEGEEGTWPEVPWQGRMGDRVGTEGSVLTSGAQLRGASLRVSASLCPPSLAFQNIPTLGSVAVTMALHGCDEVAVAGFGYDMSTPNAPLHYYEAVRMAAIREVRGWAWGSPWAGRGRGQCQHQGETVCAQMNGQGMSQWRVWLLGGPWEALPQPQLSWATRCPGPPCL